MKFIPAIMLSLLFGCSSQSMKSENSEQVVSRIDGLTERPSWFKESESFKVANGEVVSLGSTNIPADHRLESAIRIAQSNAKAGICNSIEQRLEFFFQNAEEGTAIDTNQVRFIGSEVCRLTGSSLKNDKIYWEKVLGFKSNGEKSIEYKVFATVTMSEIELKKAILESMNKRTDKLALSKTFSQSVEKNWEKITKGE